MRKTTNDKVKKYIEDKTLAKELYYNGGLSACQIAAQFRLSHSTVIRMIDDNDPMGVRKFFKSISQDGGSFSAEG